MVLTPAQRLFLRARAHKLKPVVTIGASGLHEGVINEINNSLSHHELIKVRINAGDRTTRQSMTEQIQTETLADLVQVIGHVAVFYRAAEKPAIILPKK